MAGLDRESSARNVGGRVRLSPPARPWSARGACGRPGDCAPPRPPARRLILPTRFAACRPRAVVADDDPTYCARLVRSLTGAGFEVIATPRGQEAWGCFALGRPVHLAVLNWMLPDLDGWEIARRLAGPPPTDTLTVLMAGRIAAPAARATANVLIKPFGMEATVRVAQWARRHVAHRTSREN